ncbi:acyltransferase [Leucobacter coleopterorum]|uniref:Acyltransferase n=1 Tax=Leucobacter coleopterorum TaxID=2714933 RepID=A0ABX6K2L5_9MICO|nr:acyltransferase family protein [Leucobacter coleopterorum]QIM19280.1 acyltransferase [Leucobacter coleopterorum]
MTQPDSQSPRSFRALAHRFVFHWRDDARRMTAIEAELQSARAHIDRLEAEIDELRGNSLRIVELIDVAEQQLARRLWTNPTVSSLPKVNGLQRQSGLMVSRRRLDIQGLRALAVVLVVVFHLFPRLVPGGYIGVDIFFVISGFLITGHLLREVETQGRVCVTQFWARRVRRLLPASLLVLAVSIVLTMTVMPANTRPQNYGDIGYAASYILNWRLAANSVDYLNSQFPPTLVQHYWSLSIEEQFYLVWPVLIAIVIGIAALVRKPQRRFVLAALVLVLSVSLVFSIVETSRSQPAAYFVTTTRVWEFALGGLVAMVPAARTTPLVRGLVSVVALAVVAVCAFMFGAATSFPGAIALLPVVATAVLIWCGDSDDQSWVFAPQRLTHNRVVQFLGDASYSIYLWHWPLILAVTAVFPAAGWGWRRALIVVPVTVVLAWVTLKCVEDPIRKAPGVLRRRSMTFGLMAVVVAAIVGVCVWQSVAIQQDVEKRQTELESLFGNTKTLDPVEPKLCVGAYAILNKCDNPYAYNPQLIDPAFAQEDKPWRWINDKTVEGQCTKETVGSLPERSCYFPGKGKQILVIGDSHADQLMEPLSRVAEQEGWGLRLQSRSSCAIFTLPVEDQNEDIARCLEWSKQLLDSIIADPTIDVVIVSMRIEGNVLPADPVPGLSRLRDAGKQVIIVRDTPEIGFFGPSGVRLTGPECLLAQGVNDDACSWAEDPQPSWLLAGADNLDLSVIDTHKILCSDGTCHTIIGDLVVYTDDNHLTGTFVRSLEGWLARELKLLLD